MGSIHGEQLNDPEKAFECFDKIIGIKPEYVTIYPKYIKYLIWNDEIAKAKKLIQFALTIKAVDKAEIYWLQSYISETKKEYKKALKFLRKAKKEIYNDHYYSFMENEISRIKKKSKLEQPKKASKKKGKKKKKKKKK